MKVLIKSPVQRDLLLVDPFVDLADVQQPRTCAVASDHGQLSALDDPPQFTCAHAHVLRRRGQLQQSRAELFTTSTSSSCHRSRRPTAASSFSSAVFSL